MFAEAIALGSRLGLLATFPASVNSMARELEALAPRVELETACVPQALTALQAGDGAQHDALLAGVAPKVGYCVALWLALFATAGAGEAVARVVRCPVLTSPDSAVLAMRRAIG